MLNWKYRPKDQSSAEEQSQKGTASIPEETPEGFGSKNVKTITFTVCIIVFLAIFGPLSIFQIHKMLTGPEANEGKLMTEEEMIALSQKGPYLTMKDIKGYRGEIGESDYREYYYIYFDHYIFLAVKDKETGRLDFCTLTDKETEDEIDILKDDVKAFFDSHRTNGKEQADNQ